MADRDVLGAEIDLTIVSGKDLVAKDGGGLFTKSKSSDPYVKVMFVGHEYGKTEVVKKNLNPTWNHSMKMVLEGRRFRTDADIVLSIW